MSDKKVCVIPLLDWGMTGADIETYVAMARQPKTVNMSKKGEELEYILWEDIDQEIAQRSLCGTKKEQKEWSTIKRNLNRMNKLSDDMFDIVKIVTWDNGRKYVELRYNVPKRDEGLFGYTTIPCKHLTKILRVCNRKIDLAVYVTLRGLYLSKLKQYEKKGEKPDKPVIEITPKVLSEKYLSFNEREICDAITRLKREGLLIFCLRYCAYNGITTCYRDIAIRNLDQWETLLKIEYDFTRETSKPVTAEEFEKLSGDINLVVHESSEDGFTLKIDRRKKRR